MCAVHSMDCRGWMVVHMLCCSRADEKHSTRICTHTRAAHLACCNELCDLGDKLPFHDLRITVQAWEDAGFAGQVATQLKRLHVFAERQRLPYPIVRLPCGWWKLVGM